MTTLTFDSLSSARRLREKGASQELAEAIADELRVAKDTDVSHLATKEELNTFKSELKADLAKIETKIAEAKSDTVKWMFGGLISIVTLLLGIIGLLVTVLLKLH
jgi:orotate phosphoribosyltransferase-like protein